MMKTIDRLDANDMQPNGSMTETTPRVKGTPSPSPLPPQRPKTVPLLTDGTANARLVVYITSTCSRHRSA